MTLFKLKFIDNRYGAGGFGARDYRQFNDRSNTQRNMGSARQSNGPNYGQIAPQSGYQSYGNAGMPNFMVALRGGSYGGNYSSGAAGPDWWGN